MNNFIHRGNSTFAKIGENEIIIPKEFLNDLSVLLHLRDIPDSTIWSIFTCFFEAGKECGKEKIRHELRPLVDGLCENTQIVVSAMREIEESFK